MKGPHRCVVVGVELEIAACCGGCGYRPLDLLVIEDDEVLCDLCGDIACGCAECLDELVDVEKN